MKELKAFLKKHKLKLKNLTLLQTALTHSSYVHESQGASPSNERLEYLGDSVLNLIINEYLFQRFPYYSEGDMAQLRSSLVREETLARVAHRLQLGNLLRLGKGEKKGGGTRRRSILADALEALVAAFYLDRDFAAVRTYIYNWFQEEFESLHSPQESKDAKSQLQEVTQRYLHQVPMYEEVSHSGPAHKKYYVVRVLVQGREYAHGSGPSRKDAEQAAATKALRKAAEIEYEARR